MNKPPYFIKRSNSLPDRNKREEIPKSIKGILKYWLSEANTH